MPVSQDAVKPKEEEVAILKLLVHKSPVSDWRDTQEDDTTHQYSFCRQTSWRARKPAVRPEGNVVAQDHPYSEHTCGQGQV